jgi:uncharacterized membrane protein YfcA
MGDVTAIQIGLVALSALLAGILGGVTGYGTGLLMPLVLTPIVGPAAVVPIIGLSAVLTNASRIAAFRPEVAWRTALVIAAAALPACILGAAIYAALSGRGASILIGSVLILMVPARAWLARIKVRLAGGGLVAAGTGYGLLVGGTAGSGVVLLSLLRLAGLEGRAVIATDAVVSFTLGLVKSGAFQALGALPLSSWAMAGLIGLCATPGAFIARGLTKAMPLRVHNGILDAIIVAGGVTLIVQGLRS